MIFLVDTPKDIKSGYSYVINRPEDSYTMLEGDVKLFDKIAFDLKERGVTDKPYDTLVLSFEEEDLTLEEIQEIYYDWKSMYLESYDEDEYYMTSVVHWDDDHPHIHVGIINRSTINEKHLRMTRYGVDNTKNGRNTAIQEIINYKYNLKSPIGEKFLYQTTPEQKKRDWIVHKGREFYKVEDDEIYDNMRYESIHAKDYQEFYEKMLQHYPTLEIVDKYEEEVHIKIGKKKFKSLLFNEEFYNSHLDEIKSGVDRFDISGLRKSEEDYQEQYFDKNEAHKKQLEERKIHEGLLELKVNKGELQFLKDSLNINEEFAKVSRLKALDLKYKRYRERVKKNIADVHKYIFCKEDLVELLDYAGFKLKKFAYDKRRDGGYIVIEKDETDIYINTNELYDVCLTSRNSQEYLEKTNEIRVEKLKNSVKTLNLSKRANIDIVKYQLLNDVIELNIKNEDEFNKLLNEVGLEKINEGYSVSKGGYITLREIGKTKKFSLYDDLIYSFYNEDIKLSNELLNDSVKSTLKDIKEAEDLKPESVNEFKLKNSGDVNLKAINLTGDSVDIKPKVKEERNRKASAIVEDYNDELIIKKALNFKAAGDELAKRLGSKRWEHMRLTGSSDPYQKALLDSLSYLSKESEDSRVWIDKMMIETDLSENVININKGGIYELEFKPIDNLEELMQEQYIIYEFNEYEKERKARLDNQESASSVKEAESIKEDYQEKLGKISDKKVYLREFSI